MESADEIKGCDKQRQCQYVINKVEGYIIKVRYHLKKDKHVTNQNSPHILH